MAEFFKVSHMQTENLEQAFVEAGECQQQRCEQILTDTRHELTSILSGIRLMASHWPQALTHPGGVEAIAQAIIQATANAQSVFDDCCHTLAPVYLETEGLVTRLELSALLSRQAGLLATMMVAAGPLQFKTAWANDLPLYLDVDEHRLQQVLRNWLNNAIQHSQARQLIFAVTRADQTELGRIMTNDAAVLENLRAFPQNWLVFSIQDDGIGLTEQDQDRIFERSVSSTLRLDSGLGLAIVRRLAAEMGAVLALQADCRPGCKFSLLKAL